MSALQIEFPGTFLIDSMKETVTFTTTKLENKNVLILAKVNLECTKRAFFYKGAKI